MSGEEASESLTSLNDDLKTEGIQQEVLPSLLLEVQPNPYDIEEDTLFPYFLRLRKKMAAQRAKEIEDKRQREEESQANLQSQVSFTGVTRQ